MSIYLYIYISIYLYVYISIDLYVYRSVDLYISIYLYVYMSICLYVYISIYLYIYISIYLYIYISRYLYIYISIYLYIYISIYLYIYMCIYIYTYFMLVCMYVCIYIHVYIHRTDTAARTGHYSPLLSTAWITQDNSRYLCDCLNAIFLHGILRRKPGTAKPKGPTPSEWVGTRETRCASGPSWFVQLPWAASMNFTAWQEFRASQKSMSSHWILQTMLTNILKGAIQIE